MAVNETDPSLARGVSVLMERDGHRVRVRTRGSGSDVCSGGERTVRTAHCLSPQEVTSGPTLKETNVNKNEGICGKREQHVQRPWGRRLLKEEQTSETGRERGREEVAGDKMGVPERVLGRGVA